MKRRALAIGPNPSRLAKSLKLLRRLTILRMNPKTPNVELERAKESLADHDSDARRRIDPRQLKLFD